MFTTVHEKVSETISAVHQIGYEWEESNAHCKAMSVALGLVATGEMLALKPLDPEQLKRLETAGTELLFETIPLPVYSGLVGYFLAVTRGDKWDGFDEDDGNGEVV